MGGKEREIEGEGENVCLIFLFIATKEVASFVVGCY